MMFPIQPKAKELLQKALNGSGYIYVLEGGARGGKRRLWVVEFGQSI